MIAPFFFPRPYWQHLSYVVVLPWFFISFCLFYNPFGIKDFYQGVGDRSCYFHIVLLTCIIIGVIAISRFIFWAFNRLVSFRWWQYGLWCLIEVFALALFMALYTCLFYHGRYNYFECVAYCLEYSYLVLIYPYCAMLLLRYIVCLEFDFKLRSLKEDSSLVKFYDNNRRLKLTISSSVILYISAEANYVKIHYLEGEREKVFLLRSSMKSIEDIASRHALVRCHRSYYINPKHIKLLGRSPEGLLQAEMETEGTSPVPVSKLYYESLAKVL